MQQGGQAFTGINRGIHGVQIKHIRSWDQLFELFKLMLKVHFGIFYRHQFPHAVENVTVDTRLSKLRVLTEHSVIRIHTFTQTGHKGNLLPRFKLLKTKL